MLILLFCCPFFKSFTCMPFSVAHVLRRISFANFRPWPASNPRARTRIFARCHPRNKKTFMRQYNNLHLFESFDYLAARGLARLCALVLPENASDENGSSGYSAHWQAPVFAFLLGESFQRASLQLLSREWVVILLLVAFCLAVVVSS